MGMTFEERLRAAKDKLMKGKTPPVMDDEQVQEATETEIETPQPIIPIKPMETIKLQQKPVQQPTVQQEEITQNDILLAYEELMSSEDVQLYLKVISGEEKYKTAEKMGKYINRG